jgi:hypothetical protein
MPTQTPAQRPDQALKKKLGETTKELATLKRLALKLCNAAAQMESAAVGPGVTQRAKDKAWDRLSAARTAVDKVLGIDG